MLKILCVWIIEAGLYLCVQYENTVLLYPGSYCAPNVNTMATDPSANEPHYENPDMSSLVSNEEYESGEFPNPMSPPDTIETTVNVAY